VIRTDAGFIYRNNKSLVQRQSADFITRLLFTPEPLVLYYLVGTVPTYLLMQREREDLRMAYQEKE
jgi:hypothetical protein